MIEDVTTKGTCALENNPASYLADNDIYIWGWSKPGYSCTMELYDVYYKYYAYDAYDVYYEYYAYDIQTRITKGTCSDHTERLWKAPACLKALANRRHRWSIHLYPNICSLRTKCFKAEHLCAVSNGL